MSSVRYRLDFSPAALRQYKKFSSRVQERIRRAVDRLTDQPRLPGAEKMAGEDPQYRIRVGDYRVIYEIHDRELLVLIIRVAHRSIAYRR